VTEVTLTSISQTQEKERKSTKQRITNDLHIPW